MDTGEPPLYDSIARNHGTVINLVGDADNDYYVCRITQRSLVEEFSKEEAHQK